MSKAKLLKELVERAKAGDAVANKATLQFLHNTSADKLARVQSMGGMPMPSIAVTKQDIPFDNFGDITLVGNPANFDPKASKLNQAFSADAYTVRAPQPVKIANKKAGKLFQSKYQDRLKELGVYTDETASNIWDLEKKSGADPSTYRQVDGFIEDRMTPLYIQDRGLSVDPKDYNAVSEIKRSDDYQSWVGEVKDDIFQQEEYFVSNPDRDRYSQNARLKPYTADEITKHMKKSAGRGGEGGMANKSAGGVRASTTEEIKSLQGMRDIKDRLVSSDEMAEFKQTTGMMFDDLQEAFKGNYKYQSDSWQYSDEFSEFVSLSEEKGIKAAADEIGFNPSPELAKELDDYKDMLRGGATEYFESKPKRVVEMSEFGGAIVPEGTPQHTLDYLKKNNIPVETYADETGRLAARKKFQDMAFSVGGAATAIGAATALTPEQGMANQPELALSEMTFGNGKPTAKMREAAMTELANRGIGPENMPRARFDVNAPGYNKGRRSIGDYFEGGGKKLAGAADLVGGMAYGMGQESLRGLTGLGGLAMGRGVDESMRNADALVNRLPQYNMGQNAMGLYQDAEKAYESNPEIVKDVAGEYLRAGDYWGGKVGEYSPAAGAVIKTAFDVAL